MYRLLCAAFVGLLVGGSLPVALAGGLFPDGQVKMLYVTNCAECHGAKGRGSEEGPSLHDNEYVKKRATGEIAKLIVDGIPEDKKRYPETEFASPMGGYGENLAPEEIQKLAELMKSWSR